MNKNRQETIIISSWVSIAGNALLAILKIIVGKYGSGSRRN